VNSHWGFAPGVVVGAGVVVRVDVDVVVGSGVGFGVGTGTHGFGQLWWPFSFKKDWKSAKVEFEDSPGYH